MLRCGFIFVVVSLVVALSPAFAATSGSPSLGWVSFSPIGCTVTQTGSNCGAGSVTVSVYGFYAAFSYGPGVTREAIAEGLAGQFNNFPASPVYASAGADVLTLTSKATGSSANASVISVAYSGGFAARVVGMIGGRDGKRNFQMMMWFDNDTTDADIAFVGLGAPQPPGHSILFIGIHDQNSFASAWTSGTQNFDFSRLDAVVVDEPYLNAVGSNTGGNPCSTNDPRLASIESVYEELAYEASVVKQASPKTRFWVNFSEYEMNWMIDGSCSSVDPPLIGSINGPFIDVASMDIYGQDFNTFVGVYYNWLVNHLAYPGQQLAFIPGTFVSSNGNVDPVSQSHILEEFFDSAEHANQSCKQPPSSVGTTGIFDNCLIWAVAGFLYNDCPACGGFVGLQDPMAAPIQAAWQSELATALHLPSSIASLSDSGGLVETYYQNPYGEIWRTWCFPGGCTWDDPDYDSGAPWAAPQSAVTTVLPPGGPLLHYLDASSHLIHVWSGNGFSDTWVDETTAAGIGPALPGSSLATVVAPDGTPFTYFLGSVGWVYVIWCTGSGTFCIWDSPGGDSYAPVAVTGSPLTAVWTTNGPLVHYLSPSGHVLGLWAGNGFSDIWLDETAAADFGPAGIESPLATLLASDGITSLTYFLDSSNTVAVISCTGSSCTSNSPGGDANAPHASRGSPLTVINTSNGPLVHYFTLDGYLISLRAGHGSSDTWQNETVASGAPAAAIPTSMSTVLLASGSWITHFTVPGGHVFSITCSTTTCTKNDETATTNALPAGLF